MAWRRTDEEIQSDVVDSLVGDVRVDASHLNVEVEKGRVYLRGRVPSLFVRQTAETIASRIKGVEAVVNELEVAALERMTDAVLTVAERSDKEIASAIRDAVLRELFLGPSEVSIQVEDGVVRLAGSVWSPGPRWRVEELARQTPGVVDVVNEIRLAA